MHLLISETGANFWDHFYKMLCIKYQGFMAYHVSLTERNVSSDGLINYRYSRKGIFRDVEIVQIKRLNYAAKKCKIIRSKNENYAKPL